MDFSNLTSRQRFRIEDRRRIWLEKQEGSVARYAHTFQNSTCRPVRCSTLFSPISTLTGCSQLLTLEEKDPRRLFEGNALIRRLVRTGVLDESRMKLDYVLALKVEDFLERRLQTCVYKLGLAKSIHHARVLIRQRHIRVGKQIVNVPSFIVRLDSQKHIDFALTSPFGGGRAGRVRRKKAKASEKKDEGGDDGGDEEEE